MADNARMNMHIAAIQMVSGPDVAANLAMTEKLVGQAVDQGAELVVLPEYFCLMGIQATDKLAIMETAGGPIQTFLSRCAQRHRIALVGGTVPMVSPQPHRVLNSCCVFDADGRPVARYDKIHLFGFERGAEHFDESQTIVPGRTPTVCDLTTRSGERVRVGLSICYDLRFPELYRRLAPVDLIVAPSAFTYTTGQAHWELLVRARAVENQCYLVAAAQGGEHAGGRRTWGHSMVVDPWGGVLDVVDDGPGVAMGLMDGERIAEVRASLPALKHRVL